MKNIKTYLAGALMLLMPALAGAQALPFTIADVDPVILAKGGTGLTETGAVSHAAFTNAAAIPFSEAALDVAAGYTMWQPGAAKTGILNAAGAAKLNDRLGVSAGLYYGMHPSYDITDGAGASDGTFSPSDLHAAVGVAYKFLPDMSAGVNLGYASSTLAQGHSYGTVAADLFVMAKFSQIKVAAGVSNVLGTVRSATGHEFCIPGSIALGAGYEKEFGQKHQVEAGLDFDYFFSGWTAASLGAEYTFDDLVSFRAGYRYGGDSPIPSFASVGAGVKFSGVKLNLAYLLTGSGSPLSNTLSISVGYCF